MLGCNYGVFTACLLFLVAFIALYFGKFLWFLHAWKGSTVDFCPRVFCPEVSTHGFFAGGKLCPIVKNNR